MSTPLFTVNVRKTYSWKSAYDTVFTMKTSNLYIKLGHRIRELRLLKGISQEYLAEEVGVHRTYIGAIERGEKRVSLAIVGNIAVALAVELSEIFKFGD